jgi:hypothetical protein
MYPPRTMTSRFPAILALPVAIVVLFAGCLVPTVGPTAPSQSKGVADPNTGLAVACLLTQRSIESNAKPARLHRTHR